MTEILLTIFFISVLLIFLGSGIWVAISMVGVSSIGMMLFTTGQLVMRWQQQFGEPHPHGL